MTAARVAQRLKSALGSALLAPALLGLLALGLAEMNEARAAPTFQAAGAQNDGAGALTVVWPTHQVGDIALLIVETANQGAVPFLSTAAGFVEVTNSPQGTGTAGGTAATRLSVFWARATSTSMASPVVADSGDHQVAQILTFRGVIGTGNPWDVTAGNTLTPASTTFTIPGATTTVANTLVVTIVANATDSNTAQSSGWTNANLAGLVEIADAQRNVGNGGGFGVAAGVWASTGAYGNTTGTLATSSVQGRISIALRPGTITLGNGTDPGNATLAPGGAATMAGAFTFATDSGTDTVTSVVVGLAAGTSGGLSLVEITDDAGSTVYGSVANPATDTPTITLSTNTLTATAVTTQFKIRVTPRSHANMPVPPGATYSVTAKINSWVSSFNQSGSDSAGTTVTIDNLSPANVTAASCTAGTEQVTLAWTNPADADFNSVIVLRDTAAVGDTPVEGTTYVVGNGVGGSTVACATGTSPCTDTGLTGGTAYHYRLYAKDSNGNYSATGVVPSGSPCTPASPAVPRFNACDVGTTCTNTTPSTRLYTKRAGTAFNLDITALRVNGTRDTGYTNTVTVELLDSSDSSAVPDTDGCRSSWTNIATLSPNPAFVGASNGLITVGPFTIANAYREVRVRVTNVGGAARRGCSTDNFSIRPSAFTVTSTDATNTGTSGTPAIKAGASFNLTAASVAGYNGTPSINNSLVVGTPTAGTIGGSFSAAPIGTGTAAGSSFTYSEVGNFGLGANAVFDSSFTSVDSPGTDCIVGFSNTLSGGQYGCSIGSTAVAQTTGSSGFGRFIPDNFSVSYNTPEFTPGCGTFSYVGAPFNYGTAPVITVTARNSSNATTTNYGGAYMKLTNASLTPATQATRYSRFDQLGGGATPALDVAGLPLTGADPVIGAFAAGVGTLTFSSGTGLGFTRSTTTPNAPFNADIALSLNVIDTDSVAFAGNPAAFGAATSGNGMNFTGGNKDMRFGRLRMQNASGSEKIDLQIPLQTQYWTGTGFLTNNADGCTSLSAVNLAFSAYTGGISAANMNAANISLGGAFALGVGNLKLTKPSPAATSPGSTTLTINLAAEAKSYLQGNWGVATYTANPSARAAFGLYGAQPRNFIFFRENY